MNVNVSAMVLLTSFLSGLATTGHAADRRHVPLQGQSNCRDLGGYTTEDGHKVKTGLIYRSGHLSRLTNDDIETLGNLGIAGVFSFMTDSEIRSAGDNKLPDGVKLELLPIDTDTGLAQEILRARQTADFSELPPDLNPRIHRLLVREATEQYAKLFREIAHAEEPILFHCSHGVHRTGTAAALLLWGLGVPWEQVRQDYLLSNKYRADEVKKRLGQLRDLAARNRSKSPDEIDMTNFEAFYVLKAEYIDAARDEINENYGGIQNYLTQELGLTPVELTALRGRLLRANE